MGAGIFYVRLFSVIDKLYLCTPVYVLNGHTAFLDECDEQRDRHGYFLFIMNNIIQTSNVALLSSYGTCANETGRDLFSSLCGNPYEDLASLGFDLQDVSLRFLRHPRKNGVAITGRFNVGGIYYTVGAADYPTLMIELIDDLERADAARRHRRRAKRLQVAFMAVG